MSLRQRPLQSGHLWRVFRLSGYERASSARWRLHQQARPWRVSPTTTTSPIFLSGGVCMHAKRIETTQTPTNVVFDRAPSCTGAMEPPGSKKWVD